MLDSNKGVLLLAHAIAIAAYVSQAFGYISKTDAVLHIVFTLVIISGLLFLEVRE